MDWTPVPWPFDTVRVFIVRSPSEFLLLRMICATFWLSPCCRPLAVYPTNYGSALSIVVIAVFVRERRMYVVIRRCVLSYIFDDVWTNSVTLVLKHGSDGRGYEGPWTEPRVGVSFGRYSS